jgi:hypothetical protein
MSEYDSRNDGVRSSRKATSRQLPTADASLDTKLTGSSVVMCEGIRSKRTWILAHVGSLEQVVFTKNDFPQGTRCCVNDSLN